MKLTIFSSSRHGTIRLCLALVGLSSTLISSVVSGGNVAQSPLFLTQPVKPNIMLMLDNSGSMNNIVPESPYDPATTYINCPIANQIPACSSFGCVQIRIAGGVPLIYDGSKDWSGNTGATYTLWTSVNRGQKCFDPNGTYASLLIADNGNNTAPSYRTGDADYSGNYLNWYFNASNTASWIDSQKPGTLSRLQIAKSAANSLVDSLSYVRLGLSTYYNSADGGALLETVEDIDEVSNKKTTIKNKIDALSPVNNTPLAETLSDIGHYFTTGYTGNLTLHPGKTNQSSASVSSIFTQATASDHNLYNSSGQSLVSPIQYSCQKSFAVLMTDGRPQLDRDISASLRDYTGDCAAGLCDSTPTAEPAGPTAADALPPTALTDTSFKNGTKKNRIYEWAGSDYLDDVAQALFEMDLRPDLTKTNTNDKNNLITYTIGFADPTLQNDGLLTDTANRGGGVFKPAGNSTELADAFKKIIADINNQVTKASASALGANSTRLDTSTKIYQAGFDSTDWTGSLKSFAVGTVHEDANNNGVLNSGEDKNNNNILDDIGSIIKPAKWTAESLIPTAANRRILSYNPLATSAGKGISFEWAYLNNTQKSVLDAATAATATSSLVLSYIRGDQSNETPTGTYRKRASLLGDIVNSDPLFVSNSDDFGYSLLGGTAGSSYAAFRISKSSRTNAIYVGANDGMLHAFNADTGAEMFAYVPNAVIPSLNKLTNPKYGCRESGCIPHEYFVDGGPRSGDAYFGLGSGTASWRTVLLGSTGAGGGKAIFALDVTSPSASISTDNVLWEISPNQAPVSADLSDVVSTSPTKLGFTKNLGYTIPQPALVRMQDGNWAAIVANGYNSTNNKAVLYILNAATGAIIRSIDTGKGNSATSNGLSTPIPVDVDGDRVVDYIYAGDLLGNLWKFDVTNSDSSKWTVAFGTSTSPAPLFTACSSTCSGTNFQPITAKPQVGRHPSGGLMVYFGTGKYYEAGDQIVGTTPQVHSFYGIRDQGSVVSGRGSLQEQKILAETSDIANSVVLRATTNTAVDYVGNAAATPVVLPKQGWFMDFISPINNKKGERVISQALLRGGRVIFLSITPTSEACSSGGTSWFMELDAVKGTRLDIVAFDTDNNGVLNNADKKLMDTNMDSKITTSDETVAVSGRRTLNTDGSDQGMIKGVTVLSDTETEHKITNDSKNNTNSFMESSGEAIGRQSWRQIH